MTPADRALRDTIFALSSAPGRAGVAVLRVSGPHAGTALKALSGRDLPRPRHATLCRFRDHDSDEIDQGLGLWFPSPASFTGEDSAEFHIHGGRATVEAMLRALEKFDGLRPAEPGEFTRRAVEHGKFDLTAAEAIADLVDAETDSQRKQALRQLEGRLAALYDGWRASLIRASALIEAGIDFSDEEVPKQAMEESKSIVSTIVEQIQQHIHRSSSAESVREGLYLTVIGPPNAGKSSLINALAQRDVAIVSEIAGTTRDVVETRLNLSGYLVIVADTAGLRESADAIEAEGVRRALARADVSDIRLLLLDGSKDETDEKWPLADLVVWNKTDLRWKCERAGLKLSLKTGQGLEDLVAEITRLVGEKLQSSDDAPPMTRARHKQALEHTLVHLKAAQQTEHAELIAEELRLACNAIGRITGRVDIEDVLDDLFRSFCIGK